jgi:hypothetical protein
LEVGKRSPGGKVRWNQGREQLDGMLKRGELQRGGCSTRWGRTEPAQGTAAARAAGESQ